MSKTQEKYIILKLGKGNLNTGFPQIKSEIYTANHLELSSQEGSLPPAPELIESQREWQFLYNALSKRTRGVVRKKSKPSNVSEADLNKLSEKLKKQLNTWLASESFRLIERYLYKYTNIEDKVRVIITSNDPKTRGLFWHLWDFFEDYKLAEPAINIAQKFKQKPKSQTPVGKVRILAVFGDDRGIDVTGDRQLLSQLPSAEVVTLTKQSRKELSSKLWDKKGWDIFFFAGHSFSNDQTGYLQLNDNDRLSPEELKNTIQKAVERGLQLAIINSCQGLGIGSSLDALSVPQSIIMHENVPNKIAVEFLEGFLTEFAQGALLHLAVRHAREKLEHLENEFLNATWLPIICQNPAAIPPTWRSLRDNGKFTLTVPLIASLLVTASVVGIRFLGGLQGLELAMYDYLMKTRPQATQAEIDERLLVVVEEDSNNFPLPDKDLVKVIEKLNESDPHLIGIDLFREKPKPPNNSNYGVLMEQFKENPNLIGVCSVDFAPPKFFQNKKQTSSLAYTYLPPQNKDKRVRRIGVTARPETHHPCYANHHLSTLLALRYLVEKEGIEPEIIKQGNTEKIKVGQVIFERVPLHTGIFGKREDIQYQTLLNYRNYQPKNSPPFRQVTFEQLLNNEVEPNLIKDKIVIIGINIPDQDRHLTPYGESYGVMIVAHGVSQILSAVMDEKPLLQVGSFWEDIPWIFGCSIIGAIISWRFRNRLVWFIVTQSAILILYGAGYVLFLQGRVIPLFPQIIVLEVTSLVVFSYQRWEDSLTFTLS